MTQTTASVEAVRSANIRHDLDPEKVLAQVAYKVARHEDQRARTKVAQAETMASYLADVANGRQNRWVRAPESVESIDQMYDKWIEYERTHYAKVRVIELPQAGKRFVLVYGDTPDENVTSGTGPFASFDEAAAWFMNAGR